MYCVEKTKNAEHSFSVVSIFLTQPQHSSRSTNCTFTKFLYASLTRDSSALSPFLCMKTPWHSAKIPRHHFSTQLAMAITLYHFFFQCHLARRLLNFAGMLPNSCFCYDVKVDRDICQVKTFQVNRMNRSIHNNLDFYLLTFDTSSFIKDLNVDETYIHTCFLK